MSAVIKVDSIAQAHIQAYLEYKNIVGDTDGGKLLSEEEYAKRKKKALEDQKNRIYVTWLNSNNLECRCVGPSSKCFCGHKFRDHDSCNKSKKVHCKMHKCACKLFEYIPIRGSQDLKCHCKHSYKFHNTSKTRKCFKKHPIKGICQCHGFISSFGCSCGQPFSSHFTLFETREERQKAGKRVDNLAMGTGMGCAAMGGITTFSSLIDGIDRMAIEPNNATIPVLQYQFMKPKSKLSEEEEMAIYAKKYENKSSSNYYDTNYHQHQQMQIPMSIPNEMTSTNMNNEQNNIKSVQMRNKLKLLKKRRRNSMPTKISSQKNKNENLMILNNGNNHNNMYHDGHRDNGEFDIQQKIVEIEEKLKDDTLSKATKYALKRKLKIEKSKIIRHQRRMAQDQRRFEAGL